MGQKKPPPGPAATADASDPKKRRRVAFSSVDSGVEANDCIAIYLVSCKEEVDAAESVCLDTVELNSLLEEDAKIYGYKGLKIAVWISSISFHAYADVVFESTADGGKGISDLKSTLEKIFGDTLVASKEEFLQSFSTQRNFIRSTISNGEVLQHKATSSCDVKVVRMVIGKSDAGALYSRLIPLVFLLVDGASAIDVLDPCWELYLLVEQKTDEQGEVYSILLGFTALYRFYHYPDSSRLRLSQILVLPPYQHKGYGRYILEVLSHVAVSEDIYDFTVEEPLDYFQHVRTCFDVLRLQKLDSVCNEVNLAVSNLTRGKVSKKTSDPRLIPGTRVIDDVRKSLKINKKQFLQCWEVLIYLGLDPVSKYLEDFVSIVSNRMKEDILGKESGTGGKQVIEVASEYIPEMSFVMFKSNAGEAAPTVQVDESIPTQAEQLQELVDERVNDIKSIAEKVTKHRTSIDV